MARVAEWATPALFQAGPVLPLFEPGDRVEIRPAPESVLAAGMVVRRVGEFVGRRAELRALRGPGAGVLVHGTGGWVSPPSPPSWCTSSARTPAWWSGCRRATTLTMDSLLEALRARLVAHGIEHNLDDGEPLRQAAAALLQLNVDWQARWELVRQVVLPRLRLLLVVDNAEDLLAVPDAAGARTVADRELGRLLASWIQATPAARLLITSRYPFVPADWIRRAQIVAMSWTGCGCRSSRQRWDAVRRRCATGWPGSPPRDWTGSATGPALAASRASARTSAPS